MKINNLLEEFYSQLIPIVDYCTRRSKIHTVYEYNNNCKISISMFLHLIYEPHLFSNIFLLILLDRVYSENTKKDVTMKFFHRYLLCRTHSIMQLWITSPLNYVHLSFLLSVDHMH